MLRPSGIPAQLLKRHFLYKIKIYLSTVYVSSTEYGGSTVLAVALSKEWGGGGGGGGGGNWPFHGKNNLPFLCAAVVNSLPNIHP